MKHLATAALLIGALAVSACSNGSRFGQDATAGAGAGAAAADPKSPAYFNEVVGDRVLFEVDQSVLTPAGQAVVAKQAGWLADNPEYSAVIEGHADEQGTREYNLALSARRANAVQAYLIDRGVAATRLRTVPYGKERPLEICSNEACYSQNRRAVTVLNAAGLGS